MNNVIEINDLLFEWNNKNQFILKIKELKVQNKKRLLSLAEVVQENQHYLI